MTTLVAFEVPTKPQAQRFSISLNSIIYNLVIHWCVPNSSWVVDIYDINDVLLLGGLPMVTGANLLAPYPDIAIGGQGAALIVQSDFDPDAVPTYTNLGTTGHLYFLPPQ